MKKLILVAAFFMCCLQPALCSDDPALQQLLTSAQQRADLSYGQTTPFQLDVDLVAHVKIPVPGHLTLKWETKDHWWRKLVIGSYQQIEVKNGDWRYTARNTEINPLLISDIFRLLGFDAESQRLTAKKQKNRTENGIELSCIQVEHKDSFESSRSVCLSPASNQILVDEWKESSDEQHREQFADYFDFGSHQYPRTLELQVNGIKVVTANVSNLISAPFDDALLTPPPGAIVRRECNGKTAPRLINNVDVDFSALASGDKSPGDSTVAMTVLADGSVDDVHIIQGRTPAMDAVIQKTLKLWKFKPAMCGTEPVVTDITIVVSFKIT